MSKFNQKPSSMTLNHEMVKAFAMSDKERLVTMVLTSFFHEEKYYGDNSFEIISLSTKLIQEHEAKFVAQLAIYARTKMNLRSVSHVLCAILAHEIEGKKYVKEVIKAIAIRVDDLLEILSYYIFSYGKPIPNALKRGIAIQMNQFDEYQFSKYNGNKKALSLRDVLILTHPKAKDEAQNILFQKILNKTLETPYTWETELSKNGNNKETWEKLIESRKVGLMALIRNLNNILNVGPDNFYLVIETLINLEIVLKSKILPFRFYAAYLMARENPNCTPLLLDALEKALNISIQNVPKLDGKTLIAIDTSGSMCFPISKKSKMTFSNIANLFAAMIHKICDDPIIVSFSLDLVVQKLSSKKGIIDNATSIIADGGGTDLTLPLRYLLKRNIVVDRIIYLSDNEINASFNRGDLKPTYSFLTFSNKTTTCQEFLEAYQKKINPNVFFHGIDLQGYGTQQFRGKNVEIMVGWNEEVLSMIKLVEEGTSHMISSVENIQIQTK